MSTLKYVSSNGTVIFFNRAPENRILKVGPLRDYKRSYKSVGKNFRFSKEATREFELELSCLPDGDATADKNFIINTFESDCQQGKFGRFYIDNYYLLCNVYAQSFSSESEIKGIFHTQLSLVAVSGWYKDSIQEFYNTGESESEPEITDMPFDLHAPGTNGILDNSEAIINSEVLIELSNISDRSISNPTLTIGGNAYKVNCSLTPNQRVIINPVNRTITRVNHVTKTEEDIFSLRDTAQSVFATIPKGYHAVTIVTEGLKAKVNLMQERVTPIWT